jgi:hypothetical protein
MTTSSSDILTAADSFKWKKDAYKGQGSSKKYTFPTDFHLYGGESPFRAVHQPWTAYTHIRYFCIRAIKLEIFIYNYINLNILHI